MAGPPRCRGLFDGRHRFELHDPPSGCRLVQRETFTGVLVPLFARSLYDNTAGGFRAMNTALKAVFAAPVKVIAEVLSGLGLPSANAVPVIRSLRSALHGFVTLEAGGGFGMPDDVDDSFDLLIDVVIAGVLVPSVPCAGSTAGSSQPSSCPPWPAGAGGRGHTAVLSR